MGAKVRRKAGILVLYLSKEKHFAFNEQEEEQKEQHTKKRSTLFTYLFSILFTIPCMKGATKKLDSDT